MKKWRVAVIGGSNSVMKPGYVTALPEAASSLGLPLEIVANLSIGNTTSVTGLMQLKSSGILAETDVLIIEYALNDASAYGETRKNIEQWARAYEAVIRYALITNPAIRILSCILCTRSGAHRSSISSVVSGIYYLSDWYGTAKVDINRNLIGRLGRDFHDIPGIYADAAHYSRPIMTRLIGEMLAEAVRDLVAEAPRTSPLPPPVDPANPWDANILSTAQWPNLRRVPFKNSRYDIQSVDLAGGDVAIRVEGGRLLAAQFVCVPEVARLYVTSSEAVHEIATLRPGIRDGRYRFLASMINLEHLPAGAERSTYRLSTRPPANGATLPLRQHGAVQYRGDPEKTLPLVSLLYTGKITGLVVREARPQKPAEEPAPALLAAG